ncbi:MAG TPA: sigma factor [Chthoniobacteraceae bacterium]|jgi:RNA polymerase sigma factor (sigma-70 family)|nr:sigma factor [Chthoniobacteraceae bacterium]
MTRDPREDAELISQAQLGDPGAFNGLVQRYEKRLRGILAPLIFNEEDAKDVAQEIWITVKSTLSKFDPQHGLQFGTWLSRTARWRSVDFLRKKYRSENLQTALEREPPAAEAPESWVPTERLFREFLRATFGGPSPPHQLLAFGFAKLLEWKPRRIVDELSGVPLGKLALQLEQIYGRVSAVPAEELRPCFLRLEGAMGVTFEQAIGPLTEDNKTWTTYRQARPELLRAVVGETTLGNFYTGVPEHNIVQWWDAVFRRVRKELLSREDRSCTRTRKREDAELIRERPDA